MHLLDMVVAHVDAIAGKKIIPQSIIIFTGHLFEGKPHVMVVQMKINRILFLEIFLQ